MIALQTRSFAEDYTFFGTVKTIPPRNWWSEGEFSSFFMEGIKDNDFVILIKIINQKWRAFLGGIPSKRTDNKGGRSIRYNFAGEGQCGDHSANFFYDMFCILLENYEDLAQNMSILSNLLDNEFSDVFINGFDGHRNTEDTERRIEQKLAIIKGKIHTRQTIKYGISLPEITMADILSNETAINFLKYAGILLTNADDNILCLVLTPSPLGNNVLTCMQKLWMKDSNAKGMFLSYYKAPLSGTSIKTVSLPFKVESPSVPEDKSGKKKVKISLILVILLIICAIIGIPMISKNKTTKYDIKSKDEQIIELKQTVQNLQEQKNKEEENSVTGE
jgi:hypothetical protein